MPDDFKRDAIVGAGPSRFPRYSFIARAEAIDVKSQVRRKARISDLGREGCYLDTISPFEVGTAVKIRIIKDNKWFSARGRVLYSTVGMGMGLLFTMIRAEDVVVLENWLAQPRGDAAPGEATESNVRHESSEIDEMRNFLSALVTTLVRKGTLTDTEGKALLQKLSNL